MIKKRLVFVLLIVVAFLTVVAFPQKVIAETSDNQVLLVYDSQNDVKDDKVNISALQRSLTSMNLRVRTLQQQKYQKGTLNNREYMGVITMINWHQVGLINQDFLKDRDDFSGIKLHIGENLTQTEIKQLGVQVQKIYQQQLILSDDKNKETLPFKESITVITKPADSSQQIGTLSSQQENQKKYPFGYINGKQGYLPFFSNEGLSLMVQMKMIAQLFNRSGSNQPLLTITDVSPYTNLAALDKLSLFLYKKQIPFSISMTSVSENTEMKAFDRFAAVLRNVENRGGIIFLQTPMVSSGIDTQGQIINKNFLTYIVSLARKQVFPVGISSEGFWNQDKVLRKNSLDFADHWLLLPNGKKVTYINEDDNSGIAKKTFFGMSASSLNNVKKDNDTSFSIPTALTISMPYSQKQLEHVESEIEDLNLNWYDPVDNNLRSELNTETTSLQYNHGQYMVNGKMEDIHPASSDLDKQFSDGKPTSLFSNFF